MHISKIVVLLIMFLAFFTSAGTIVTPLFPYKDGEASVVGYSGSGKEIIVDGGATKVIAWVTFQTEGMDLSGVKKAVLLLSVKTLDAPGTLKIGKITAPVTKPENYVSFTDIAYDKTALLNTVPLGSTGIERIVQIDISAILQDSAVQGIVLFSNDGLQISFCSREGNRQPMIMLSNEVANSGNKWICGNGIPAVALGDDGDSYIDTASGNLFTRSSGAWTITMNIKGPKGDKGDAGLQGEKGDRGDAGLQGAKGDKGDVGLQGAKGDKGDIGLQGVKGDKGDTGLQGVKGDKGEKGEICDTALFREVQTLGEETRSSLLTGNLVRNAMFEKGLVDWELTKGSPVSLVTTVNGPYGKRAIQTGTDTKTLAWINSTKWIEIKIGGSYIIKGAFKKIDNMLSTGLFYPIIRLRDNNGQEIEGALPGTFWRFTVDSYNPEDTNWHIFQVHIGAGSEFPLPDSAGSMTIGAILNAESSSCTVAGNRTFQVQGLTVMHGYNGIEKGGRIKDKTGFVMPVGTVLPFAGKSVPEGWILCNGDTINRIRFSDLFAVIDTIYGKGNGSTTFHVPDMRRRVPVGAGGTVINDSLPNTLGSKGGEEMHKLTINEMPSHDHDAPVWISGAGTKITTFYQYNGANNIRDFRVNSSGSDTPHNNIQPSIILNYIIKY